MFYCIFHSLSFQFSSETFDIYFGIILCFHDAPEQRYLLPLLKYINWSFGFIIFSHLVNEQQFTMSCHNLICFHFFTHLLLFLCKPSLPLHVQVVWSGGQRKENNNSVTLLFKWESQIVSDSLQEAFLFRAKLCCCEGKPKVDGVNDLYYKKHTLWSAVRGKVANGG